MTVAIPGAEGNSQGIPIVMCTIACREKLLDEALQMARRLSFDGVEMWGREPHTPEKFEENRMRGAKKLLGDLGLPVYVFGSYLRFGATRREDRVRLDDTLHVARWLRTPLIRVWASDTGSHGAPAEVWQRAVREAGEACDSAAKLDMSLVVEMHGGTLADTAESAVRLVEEVGRDNLKLNFQVASAKDGQTPEERLEMVLPWVAHVHAQNYEKLPDLEGDPIKRTPLASGTADYATLLGMLKDAGYQGCVAVEFAYDESDEKEAALADDLAFLRSISGDCSP